MSEWVDVIDNTFCNFLFWVDKLLLPTHLQALTESIWSGLQLVVLRQKSSPQQQGMYRIKVWDINHKGLQWRTQDRGCLRFLSKTVGKRRNFGRGGGGIPILSPPPPPRSANGVTSGGGLCVGFQSRGCLSGTICRKTKKFWPRGHPPQPPPRSANGVTSGGCLCRDRIPIKRVSLRSQQVSGVLCLRGSCNCTQFPDLHQQFRFV